MRTAEARKITVALAGNPNVGKSTLFNALTGMHQHTGNWPGKTVSTARGIMRRAGVEYHFVDLPGTYALDGKSEDERLAAAYIESGEADCTVVVCDGGCLERNLILALQILARTERVVLCVNLMDEAERRGIAVDGERLEEMLGVPVVLTAAGRKRGIDTLLKRVEAVSGSQPKPAKAPQDDPVAAAEAIAARCVTRRSEEDNWRRVLDRVLVSRRYGIPILLLLLVLIVWLTVWGANYPSELLEKLFDGGYVLLCRCLVGTPWLSLIHI